MNINKSQYINNIHENSKRLLVLIDKKHQDFIGNNENIAAKEYQQYLSARLENPVMTAIIMNDTLKQNPIKNNDAIMNLIRLEKHPEVDTLVKKCEPSFFIHERTGHIRNAILENGRICAEKVTPKLNGLKKMLFKLKLI